MSDIDDLNTWNHSGGGHLVIFSPVAPTTTARKLVGTPAGDIMISGFYCVDAPSQRAEGAYTVNAAPLLDVDGAFTRWVDDQAAARIESNKSKNKTAKPSPVMAGGLSFQLKGLDVAEWEREHSWAELLALWGWNEEDRPEPCGCSVFSRPGGSSPRSAVAHDEFCQSGDATVLNVYTAVIPDAWDEYARDVSGSGVRTLTKFDLLAADNDTDKAEGYRLAGIAVHEEVNAARALDAIEIDSAATPHHAAPMFGAPVPTEVQPAPVHTVVPDSGPTEVSNIASAGAPASLIQPAPAQSSPEHPFDIIRRLAPSASVGSDGRLYVFPRPGSISSRWLTEETAADAVTLLGMIKAETGHTPSPTEVFAVCKAVTTAGAVSPLDRTAWPAGFPASPSTIRRIMGFSPLTRAVYTTAVNGSRAINPVASYMSVLAAVARRIHPTVKAPTDSGGHYSPLNLFVLLTAGSGGGKTQAAMSLGGLWRDDSGRMTPWQFTGTGIQPATMPQDTDPLKRATKPEEANLHTVALTDNDPRLTKPAPVGGSQLMTMKSDHPDMPSNVATGEALADVMTEANTNSAGKPVGGVRLKARAVVRYEPDEIKSTLARGRGSGASLIPSLLSAWTGAAIGTDTKTMGRGTVDGDYRITVVAGVQPRLWADLQDQGDTGFIQRCLMISPAWPWGASMFGIDPVAPVSLRVPNEVTTCSRFTMCPAVADAVENDDFCPQAGDMAEDVAGFYSHATLNAIRIACIVAAAHGMGHITEAIWQHTIDIMNYHACSFRGFIAQSERIVTEAALERGAIQALVDEGRRSAGATRTQKLAELVLGSIPEVGSVTEGTIKRGLSTQQRAMFPEVVAALEQAGHITRSPGTRRGSWDIARTPRAS